MKSKKILIMGLPGSGKTTLAKNIVKKLNSEWLNADKIRGKYNDWEVVIGLEIHAQLLTKSKMFCNCAADYQDSRPNTFVCPICMGMPGVMPKINRLAVEHVIKTGLALNCSISKYS